MSRDHECQSCDGELSEADLENGRRICKDCAEPVHELVLPGQLSLLDGARICKDCAEPVHELVLPGQLSLLDGLPPESDDTSKTCEAPAPTETVPAAVWTAESVTIVEPVPTVGKWCAGTDEENMSGGPYDSREHAVASYPDENGLADGTGFWVGEMAEIDLVIEFGPAYRMIEGMQEHVYDNCGGDGDTPDATAAQLAELDDLIRQWMTKHGIAPTRYSVLHAEWVTYEQCDLMCGAMKPGEVWGDDFAESFRCQLALDHDEPCDFRGWLAARAARPCAHLGERVTRMTSVVCADCHEAV